MFYGWRLKLPVRIGARGSVTAMLPSSLFFSSMIESSQLGMSKPKFQAADAGGSKGFSGSLMDTS